MIRRFQEFKGIRKLNVRIFFHTLPDDGNAQTKELITLAIFPLPRLEKSKRMARNFWIPEFLQPPNNFLGQCHYRSIPAMQAVMKAAREPAIMDFKPSFAKSFLRLGTSEPMPPI